MGPILIFDKSFLESLNPNEAVWLEQFFITNLTPLFYLETLADLAKNGRESRKPEKLVKDLASKTPQQNILPNIYAGDLIISELLGNHIEMSQKPLINNIKTGETSRGEYVSRIEETHEEKALNRWQEDEFNYLEKNFAREWRKSLPQVIKSSNLEIIKNILTNDSKLTSYTDIYKFTQDFIANQDENILFLVEKLLQIPSEIIKKAQERWKEDENTSLFSIAPYTAFVLWIEILFHIGILTNLISREKINNRTDFLYLHYLPFTDIFVSYDKLHRKIVPLFLRNKQLFVIGSDLKNALSELNQYFESLPEKEKAKGVIHIANLPKDSDNLVCQIWDSYFPKWREKKQNLDLTEDEKRMLLAKIKRLSKEKLSDTSGTFEESNEIIKKIKIKRHRGDWNMLPDDLENKD